MFATRFALIFALVLLPASSFRADTFQVTKPWDTKDGICGSDCSLREAIDAANANPGADKVTVPAGLYLLIRFEPLMVSDDVSIVGAGQEDSIIDGWEADRVLEISHSLSGAVSISGVTIRNGYPAGSMTGPLPNSSGAGIFSRGILTLINSTVSDNRSGGKYGSGGGIRHTGSLTLNNSTVSGNTASGGGGILITGTLTLTNSRVSGNTATRGVGGGIAGNGGGMTLIDSTVSGNTAFASGGGIATYSYYGAASMVLTNSTVSGNTSLDGSGGGISYGSFPDGEMTLTNSTVSGNTAFRSGGGISIIARYYGGDFTLTNSTVSGNDANEGGAGIDSFIEGGGLTFSHTIVADNGTSSPNCNNNTVNSLGYNLTDDSSCGFTAPGDLIVADAKLGPLQDNGGPTETHDLLPGSPGIDAGSMNCPPPATDQRGVARPQGMDCDIGAVEFVPEPRGSVVVTAGAVFLGLLYRRRVQRLRLG